VIEHQIKARLCRSVFYNCQSQPGIAEFHREKAQALARQYNLQRWLEMMDRLLCVPCDEGYRSAGLRLMLGAQ